MKRTRRIDQAAAAENMAKLPEICYTYLNSDPELVIAIKRGETGYYPIGRKSESRTAEYLNSGLDPVPTKAQIEAMMIGSMFGWDCPGADVDVIGEKLPA